MPVAFSNAVGLLNATPGDAAMPAISVTGPNVALLLIIQCNGASFTSVTDTAGMTWALRGRATNSFGFVLELWAAFRSTTVTNNVVTAHPSGSQAFQSIVLAGFSGATGFATGSLPVITTTAGQISISPTSAQGMAIAAYRFSSTQVPTPGAGFTQAGSSATTNYTLVEFQSFSTTQTNLILDVGTGANDQNGGIGDALIGPASGVVTTLFPKSLVATWTNSTVGDTPILNQMQYRVTGQSTFIDNTIQGPTSGSVSYLIGLTPNTSYDLRVTASNSVGSASSSIFTIMTAPMPVGATAVIDARIQPPDSFQDSVGSLWSITAGGQCMFNQQTDLNTASVIQMALTNSGTVIWQQNSSLNWYAKNAVLPTVQGGWAGPNPAPF
jgi:hypothetical protein